MTDPEQQPDNSDPASGGSQADNDSGSANQAKVEPFTRHETPSPTPGATDPQQPTVGEPVDGSGHVGDADTAPVNSEQALEGSSESLPVVQGVHDGESTAT